MEAIQFPALRLQHWALSHTIGTSAIDPQTKWLSSLHEGEEVQVGSSEFAEAGGN